MLSDKHLKYGFTYFHKDAPQPRTVTEVAEYQNESILMIDCTQLGDSGNYKTQKTKKRVLNEWCDFLRENPTAFEELHFCSRMPQILFDAVCAQERLKALHIKWGVYTDISRVANLRDLQYLHIGSGAGVQSIEPIAKLEQLVALSFENFQKIHDYGPLVHLKNLESLTIVGNISCPQYIHVDSLDFLIKMPNLRFFRFLCVRLASKDMTPVLHLANIEHLSLEMSKETKEIYKQLMLMPKLKYGFLVDKPECYTQ